MAGKIRATIALDGEKEYRSALRECKKETQNLKNELSVLSAEYRDNKESVEALSKQNETLTKKQEACKKQLDLALDGLKNAKTQYDECSDKVEELAKELDNARKKQDEMKKSGDDSSDTYKEQERHVNELEKELSQYSDKQDLAQKSVNRWQKEVITANKELNTCDKELEQNERDLDAARRATDKAGTSMENFADDTEDAAKQSGKLSISIGDMVKNKIVDMAGNALVSLGRKAIEAAKYIVQVGSDFEAQMSRVQAIAGTSLADTEKLSQQALDLARSTKFTASQAGEALTLRYKAYSGAAMWKLIA